MMARTEAIVLKKTPHRENDWRVCFFTRDFGKIEAIAAGARKIKSKLAGHLASPGVVEIIISEGRNGYKLTQAHLVERFSLEWNMPFYFSLLEVVDKTLMAQEKLPSLWQSTVWALQNLEKLKGDDEKALFFNVFLLRWIKLSGYQIEVQKSSCDLSGKIKEVIGAAQSQSGLTVLKLAREENFQLSRFLEKAFCDIWEKGFNCLALLTKARPSGMM